MLEKTRKLSIQEIEELPINIPTKQAYIIELEKVIEERCDELDYNLEYQGYQIIHRDYITLSTNIYNYKVIFINCPTNVGLIS
ncbi:MAG: hypothetical protein N4A33_04080 [Bacteriovoracaceae bacterium]|jgi:hypothetical protein|nr:hypothetical protein [Bacteriovoracaceae bacterium]